MSPGRLLAAIVVGLVLAVSLAVPGDARRAATARGRVLDVGPAPSSTSYPRGTSAHTVVYTSIDSAHRPIRVSGLVLTPPGPAPARGWPVVAWDHGTTGIGDDCAPSLLPGAAYPKQLGALLRAGYAVAATDYSGLGTPGVHPYLLAPDAALATVDMVRAAHALDPRVSTRWAAVGHSQGGQAAWATAELPARERAGTDYRGAVAFAPAPNFGPLLADLRGSADPLEQEFLLMTLVGLHTAVPFAYSRYLGPQARAQLPAARTVCFDDLTQVLTDAHVPGRDILPRPSALSRLAQDLRPYEIAHRRPHAPLLVLQGLADAAVPPASTRAEVAEARTRGGDVALRTFPGATHGSLLDAGWPSVTSWLDDHLSAHARAR